MKSHYPGEHSVNYDAENAMQEAPSRDFTAGSFRRIRNQISEWLPLNFLKPVITAAMTKHPKRLLIKLEWVWV